MVTRHRSVDLERLARNSKWATHPLELEFMGADPNHDLPRALQVSDSEPVDPKQLMLVNGKVVAGEATGSPIELEAIQAGVVLHMWPKIDRAL